MIETVNAIVSVFVVFNRYGREMDGKSGSTQVVIYRFINFLFFLPASISFSLVHMRNVEIYRALTPADHEWKEKESILLLLVSLQGASGLLPSTRSFWYDGLRTQPYPREHLPPTLM